MKESIHTRRYTPHMHTYEEAKKETFAVRCEHWLTEHEKKSKKRRAARVRDKAKWNCERILIVLYREMSMPQMSVEFCVFSCASVRPICQCPEQTNAKLRKNFYTDEPINWEAKNSNGILCVCRIKKNKLFVYKIEIKYKMEISLNIRSA